MANNYASTLTSKTRKLAKTVLKLVMVLAVVAVLVLLFLLFSSTGNTSNMSDQFDILLLINLILIFALFLWVVSLVWRLYKQRRNKEFGAQITTRMTAVFAVMAIVPGLLIYFVSVQYLSKSVESWFNVKVDSALESGLSLGQASLDSLVSDLSARARMIASDLDNVPDEQISSALTQLREENPVVADALVFSTASSGRVIGFSSSSFGTLLPKMPSNNILNQLKVSRQYHQVEMVSEKEEARSQMMIRSIVPVFGTRYRFEYGSHSDPYWLQLTRKVPDSIANHLNEVQAGFKDYQELALSRKGIRTLFIITLSVALFLTVLVALWVAVSLARRLAQPLLRLAEGTQAVAIGDYRPLPEPKTQDEIAQLTRSFNMMTFQLDEARQQVERNRLQLQKSNVFLESVMRSLSSGVIVFDEKFYVSSVNKGAELILGERLRTVPGRPLEIIDSLKDFASQVRKAFATHQAVGSNRNYWQEQIELHVEKSGVLESLTHYKTLTLLLRGTRLFVDDEFAGYLVVFDDISEVISANRAVAWGEVARRLAHEIKNPLTPIQLSAERLAMKLEDKLEAKEAQMLIRSTNTIVNQVASLKKMVDDFREYARTPPSKFEAINLNELLTDLAVLYGWDPITQSKHEPLVKQIALHLDQNIPLIEADPTQLRQVLNNLLANARDAMDGLELTGDEAGVTITTQLVNSEKSDLVQQVVRITIEDRGAGFNPEILKSVFEPYVTTKSHGTGLGLPIVKRIIEEHQGTIEITNRDKEGAKISILLTLLSKFTKK